MGEAGSKCDLCTPGTVGEMRLEGVARVILGRLLTTMLRNPVPIL